MQSRSYKANWRAPSNKCNFHTVKHIPEKVRDADCSQEATRLVCFTYTENTSCSKCFAKYLELCKTKWTCSTTYRKCCSFCPNICWVIKKKRMLFWLLCGYWTGAVNTGFQRKVLFSFLFRDRKPYMLENSERKEKKQKRRHWISSYTDCF